MDSDRVIAFTRRLPFARLSTYRRGRLLRYPRYPLSDRLRASIASAGLRRADLRNSRTRLRYAADDLGHSVRNRNSLIRVACAIGAIGLMFLLLSSSGSPRTQGQVLHGADPSAASASTNSGQSAVTAAPAQRASAAPAASRHRAPAAHPARHTRVAVQHVGATPTPAAPSPASTTHAPQVTTAPSAPASHATPQKTSTPATPTPTKHSTPSSPKQATPPSTQPAVNPCTSGAVGCGGGLIFGDGPTTLATAPAIALPSYERVAVGTTTLSQIIARFGAPLSTGALRTFIGAGAYAGLVGAEPSGDSCAYYLDSSLRTTRAFQLCFNGAHKLTDKAVISTSGDGSSGTS
jgi:hypothetical protein